MLECKYCLSEIKEKSIICKHCGQFQKFDVRGIILSKRNTISIIALIFSLLSIVISFLLYYHEKDVETHRLAIETMKEMKDVQGKLRKILSKKTEADRLTNNELFLLNYYEVISKTFASNFDPSETFSKAILVGIHSVNLRSGPYPNDNKIGIVYENEIVVVLGKFSYSDKKFWYHVITKKRKIGWAIGEWFKFIKD